MTLSPRHTDESFAVLRLLDEIGLIIRLGSVSLGIKLEWICRVLYPGVP